MLQNSKGTKKQSSFYSQSQLTAPWFLFQKYSMHILEGADCIFIVYQGLDDQYQSASQATHLPSFSV